MIRFVLPAVLVILVGIITLTVLGVRRKRPGYFLGAGALVLLLAAGYFLLISWITAM